MPPASKKKPNKSATGDDFETATYTSNQLKTTTTLLTVTDDAVVIKALDRLNKYALDICDHKHKLLGENITEKLQKTVTSSNDVVVKLTLKLVAELLRDPRIKPACLPDFQVEFVDRLSYLVSEHKNETVKEYCLHIFLALLESPELRSHACDKTMILKLFTSLEKARDPDVQKNTLEILCNLLNPREEVHTDLPSAEAKHVKLLLCYLLHEFKEIQMLGMQLLEQLSQYECSNFHQVMVDCKVVEKMLDILKDADKEYLQERAKNVTLNFIGYETLSQTFIRSLEWKAYLQFAAACADKCAVAACDIIKEVCSVAQYHQPLFDLSADQTVLSLFRLTDHKSRATVCVTIKELLSHEGFCEKLLTEESLGVIIGLVSNEDTCRTALNTIHCFLKKNRSTMCMLHKLHGFEQILEMFLDCDNTDNELYDVIMDIVRTYASIAAYSEDILTERFCRVTLAQIKEHPTEALQLMNCFAYSDEFLAMFLDFDGPRILVETIGILHEEQILKDAIVFIHTIIKNKNICRTFLKERLYKRLASIEENIKGTIPLINHLENKLYDMYLPLKFHVKGKLEVGDKLESGFYLIDGLWSGEFPFLTSLLCEKISTEFTVYTVDYSYGAIMTSKPEESVQKGIMYQKLPINGCRKESFDERLINLILSDTDTISSESVDLVVDQYLPMFVLAAFKTIYSKANANVGPKEKASILAQYVERKTSGGAQNETPQQHDYYYGYHVATLKQKLGSNAIPIGYVRSGRHCERALLFKAIADRVGIPATLARGNKGIYWNEIPLPLASEEYTTAKSRKNRMIYGIVDLVDNVGSVMVAGGASAKRYCQGV